MTQTIEARREVEFEKYRTAYRNPHYRMGAKRGTAWQMWLYNQCTKGYTSVLDVACGRGESLGIATSPMLGYQEVKGYEVVQQLVDSHPLIEKIEGVHKLPADDNSFDIVACQDAFEHILEDDVLPGLRELIRVARHKVFLSVAWFECQCGKALNMDLHITRRPLTWWNEQIMSVLPEGAALRELTNLPKYDDSAILEITL